MNKPSVNYNKFVSDILQQLTQQNTQKQQIFGLLAQSDQKIADQITQNKYQVSNRLTKYKNYLENTTSNNINNMNSSTLAVPKTNTLTDSLLRSTLGCQQKLAKQYHEIFKKVNLNEEQQKKQRIDKIKKSFTQSTSFKDFFANAKAFKSPTKNANKPLIDNQHDQYLKTHLMFLQKPKTLNQNIVFHNKKLKEVANRIDELGGIQDTINNMQNTLKNHEMSDSKKNQTFSTLQQNHYLSNSHYQTGIISETSVDFQRLNKSKQLRLSFQKNFS